MTMFCNNDKQVVEVKPFAHQVGGHSCVFEITTETICKPYQEQEFQFYQNLPDNMKEFTPNYLGLICVKCHQGDINPTFHAEVPGYILRREGKSNDRSSADDAKTGLDNWSLSCVDRQIHRYGFWSKDEAHEFIMLENLVGPLKMPCVLDLKMGTRQHGCHTSEEKRKLLEDRCTNSTSGTLGFRICGMQVYNADTNTYISHDKYFGRSLDDLGVRRELRQFFCNGRGLKIQELCRVLHKLQRLRQTLSSQNAFYFFSCSLLLVYDGYDEVEQDPDEPVADLVVANESSAADSDESRRKSDSPERCRADDVLSMGTGDVRLIDFAHTVLKKDVEGQISGVDGGIVFGLSNLIQILQSILDNEVSDIHVAV